ncbi:m7GpppX diphosphatase [Musca vetustissima]|uniref:m7GpppX diphosphatase n=1 Tax=Musca vetustissima TaxID=27455 RepID=UPI002AB7189D|nr:m7GpppX diphosphatase [Musca vetustissima]
MPEQSLIISEISEEITTENGADTSVVDASEATPEIKATSPTELKQTPTSNYDLNKFQLHRILNNNTRNKSIALLGSFPNISDTDNAIVILEKHAFRESDVSTTTAKDKENNDQVGESTKNGSKLVAPGRGSYFGNDLKVQTDFINNVYGSYQCTPPAELNGVKATVVYPATEKHIEKYSICQKYLINETPEYYKDITLPYITSSQFSLEWVYNILEHKQETERIIYEDSDKETGFILLPDLKWDGRNVENLYVLAITHKHDIKSIRDLNASHLPLLRNIRNRTSEAVEKRYGLAASQLRMYFHYQPSFYHLHLHINPIRNDAPGIWCEKSHMLDTVINNLELMSDYYARATLPFVLYEGNKLLELYEEEIDIRKAPKRLADHDHVEKEEDGIEVKKPKLETADDNVSTTDKVTSAS